MEEDEATTMKFCHHTNLDDLLHTKILKLWWSEGLCRENGSNYNQHVMRNTRIKWGASSFAINSR